MGLVKRDPGLALKIWVWVRCSCANVPNTTC